MRWSCVRWVCFVSSLWACWSCAGAEDIVDGGTTSVDALFGCTASPCDGPPLPPPQDMKVPDPGPQPTPVDFGLPAPDMRPEIPQDCSPGTRIGPCALCNLDGVPEMPENDANCPPIDCGGDELYERVVQGDGQICYVTRRTPLVGNCRALGECHDDPSTFCGEPTREEVERFVPGPCISIAGCEGEIPPMVEELAPGTPCNGVGLCDVEGNCTVDEACTAFIAQQRSELCGGGQEVDGRPYCEFHVEQGRTTCNIFCQNNGAVCVRAWNNDGDRVCVTNVGQPLNCNDDFESFICHCIPQ